MQNAVLNLSPSVATVVTKSAIGNMHRKEGLSSAATLRTATRSSKVGSSYLAVHMDRLSSATCLEKINRINRRQGSGEGGGGVLKEGGALQEGGGLRQISRLRKKGKQYSYTRITQVWKILEQKFDGQTCCDFRSETGFRRFPSTCIPPHSVTESTHRKRPNMCSVRALSDELGEQQTANQARQQAASQATPPLTELHHSAGMHCTCTLYDSQ